MPTGRAGKISLRRVGGGQPACFWEVDSIVLALIYHPFFEGGGERESATVVEANPSPVSRVPGGKSVESTTCGKVSPVPVCKTPFNLVLLVCAGLAWLGGERSRLIWLSKMYAKTKLNSLFEL